MLADILILSSFIGIEDVFGEVAVIGNSSNLITVDIFADQFLPVLYGSLFSNVNGTNWPPRDTFPKSDIHIFRSLII